MFLGQTLADGDKRLLSVDFPESKHGSVPLKQAFISQENHLQLLHLGILIDLVRRSRVIGLEVELLHVNAFDLPFLSRLLPLEKLLGQETRLVQHH